MKGNETVSVISPRSADETNDLLEFILHMRGEDDGWAYSC